MNNLIPNNTLDGWRASVGASRHRPQDMTGTRLVNNIFTSGLSQFMPNATFTNNIAHTADANFVDRARYDYRLKADSPAVDAGTPLAPHTHGFAGEFRRRERERAATRPTTRP